jgi:peptidoglycan/LPS O-acetylase OafA/YrhL
MPASHLRSIDFLRGFAALSVCLFHFTTHFLSDSNPLRIPFEHGHLGVELFFVISGFIIPYSLWRKKYTIAGFGKFMKARLLRLHPAYLGSVVIMVGVVLMPNILPEPFRKPASIDWGNVLLHFFYLPPFVGQTWLNIIYWSLAAELQYYVLLGLGFSLISHPKKWVIYGTLAAFGSSAFWDIKGTIVTWTGQPFCDNNNFVFFYALLFIPGIALFLHYIEKIKAWEFLLVLVLDAYLLYSQRHEWSRPMAVVLACSVIHFGGLKTKVTDFLGKISYSLYLIHTPIGFAFLGLFTYYVKDEIQRTALVLTALLLSIFTAYWYHRLVELPTQKWAKANY